MSKRNERKARKLIMNLCKYNEKIRLFYLKTNKDFPLFRNIWEQIDDIIDYIKAKGFLKPIFRNGKVRYK